MVSFWEGWRRSSRWWAAALALCYGQVFAQEPLGTAAEGLQVVWPTPSRAYWEGKGFAAFVQPTASGEVTSGLYGCRRSGGAQFHEGVDIKPTQRDRQGEPTDPIFAVMDGVVRYVNAQAGESSYGRYIVLEHPSVSPSVFTLYGHLRRVAPGLKAGQSVARGESIGTMGRSASTYAIPKDRAHLHFEIGVWLTRDFQSWYDWKKFGSKNEHGLWNGMNLLGVDPLAFFDAYRAGKLRSVQDFFAGMREAVRLRIAVAKTPDFVSRYPALLTKGIVEGAFGGWEISFNEMGVPYAWTPLSPMDVVDMRPGEIRVAATNDALLRANDCKSLVFSKRGRQAIGSDLESVLQLLFGLRKEL